MSNIQVIHDTEYVFSEAVFLEPHYIRLQPKTIEGTAPVSFELDIHPKPTGIKKILDEENNFVHIAWFENLTKTLTIRSTSVLQVSDQYNPFHYLIYPSTFEQFPVQYSESQIERLSAALISIPVCLELTKFGNELLETSNGQVIVFLSKLTSQIHTEFETVYREEGEPFSPDDTWRQKSGSCRDLAWMQIHLMRSLGLASRFVSGYFYADFDTYELHAWVEVFIPGAGWLGFDPSYGIAASSTHLPMVYSVNYQNTMPVTGNFRGKASSKLSTKIVINPINNHVD